MRYEIEQEIERHWYPVAGPPDSDSAVQAVAHSALSAGLYRVRPAGRSESPYQLFRVPAWGPPISLGTS